MKRFFIVFISLLFSLSLFGQPRRLSTTRTQASQEQSEVVYTPEPNYDPIITKIGKVFDVKDGVAYVRISSRYSERGEGYYYFYTCNIKAQATAILQFKNESYKNMRAMEITQGSCEKGDNLYLRFVPKAPMDVILPF